MSLFTITLCPFECIARDKPNRFEDKAEIHERRIALKAWRYFNTVENASSNQDVLGENALKETSWQEAFGEKAAVSLRITSKL